MKFTVDNILMEEVMEKIRVKNNLETVGNQAYLSGRYLICDLYLREGIPIGNICVLCVTLKFLSGCSFKK